MKNIIISNLFLLSLIIFLNGCGSIYSLADKPGIWEADYPYPRVNYGGVRYNFAEIVWKSNQGGPIPITILGSLIDIPLCFAIDTIALPYTVFTDDKPMNYYDKKDGETIVTHRDAQYRIIGQIRKSDSMHLLFLEPLNDKTSLELKELFVRLSPDRTKSAIIIKLNVCCAYKNEGGDISETTIDTAYVWEKTVDELDRIGDYVIEFEKPTEEFTLALYTRGKVELDDKLKKELNMLKHRDNTSPKDDTKVNPN